jgi:hypothetical protein
MQCAICLIWIYANRQAIFSALYWKNSCFEFIPDICTLNGDFLDLFIFGITVKKKLFSDVGVHKQVLIKIRVS